MNRVVGFFLRLVQPLESCEPRVLAAASVEGKPTTEQRRSSTSATTRDRDVLVKRGSGWRGPAGVSVRSAYRVRSSVVGQPEHLVERSERDLQAGCVAGDGDAVLRADERGGGS